MVTIRIDKTNNPFECTKLGEIICAALKGNKAFVDSDILVNYDSNPDFILIRLGEHNNDDVDLNFDWPYWINRTTWFGGEEEASEQ